MGVASSLREIAEGVATRWLETHPTIRIEKIFGASSTHARQLQLGAPFDLLISADAELMESLEQGDWLTQGSIREIARGRLILVGGASADAHGSKATASSAGIPIQSTDFASRFLGEEVRRVGVPSEIVPLGRYARAWLRGQNLLGPLAGKLVTTEHARANLSAVESGHVDLAFAYGSDRRLLRDARFLGELNEKDYPPIRYVAALSKRGAQCPAAKTLLAAWSQARTQSALSEAGFLPAKKGSEWP